ncbi:MAG: RluA family pseudouridine synthase [Oscillospiraceae bacterium]
MRKFVYTIEEKDDNRTVENFLRQEKGYSRRIITRLKLSKEDISLNGGHIKMIDSLHTGDVLTTILREETGVKPNYELTVPIVYEDEDVIVYNKPPFMPIHPSNGHLEDTLGNVFCAHMQKLGIDAAFHPINRLDRDTSGLCVVAKNSLATRMLFDNMTKEYTAIVCGKVIPKIGKIDAPIMRLSGSKIQRCIGDEGQRAVTNYKVELETAKYSLVRVNLETGRTHQIRVHFAHIGNPLAGDSMYGGDMNDINRQALCCSRVGFMHPIMNKCIHLCIDIQSDMYKLVQNE